MKTIDQKADEYSKNKIAELRTILPGVNTQLSTLLKLAFIHGANSVKKS